MKTFSFKKIAMMSLSVIMAVSAMSISVFAAEETSTSEAFETLTENGDLSVVIESNEFKIYTEDGKSISTSSDVVAILQKNMLFGSYLFESDVWIL